MVINPRRLEVYLVLGLSTLKGLGDDIRVPEKCTGISVYIEW